MTPCAHDFENAREHTWPISRGWIECPLCHADITAEYLEWLKKKGNAAINNQTQPTLFDHWLALHNEIDTPLTVTPAETENSRRER